MYFTLVLFGLLTWGTTVGGHHHSMHPRVFYNVLPMDCVRMTQELVLVNIHTSTQDLCGEKRAHIQWRYTKGFLGTFSDGQCTKFSNPATRLLMWFLITSVPPQHHFVINNWHVQTLHFTNIGKTPFPFLSIMYCGMAQEPESGK